MISLFHIMPKRYLYHQLDFEPTRARNLMAMAHLVSSDPEYAARLAAKGSETRVFLDNSAPYFGRAIENRILMEAVQLIGPEVVILPDVLGDATQTIERSKQFLREIGDTSKIAFMGVPQGGSLDDYMKCYSYFANNSRVSRIGLSYTVDSLFCSQKSNKHYVSSRFHLIEELECKNLIDTTREHHLLGLGDSGHFELQHLSGLPYIKSCDSSAAYVIAASGVSIAPGVAYSKPKIGINFEDTFSNVTYSLMRENEEALARAAWYGTSNSISY